jgi:hypothetical protein
MKLANANVGPLFALLKVRGSQWRLSDFGKGVAFDHPCKGCIEAAPFSFRSRQRIGAAGGAVLQRYP